MTRGNASRSRLPRQAEPEDTLGRITRSGSWDRRYRIRHEPAEPVDVDPMGTVVEILVGTIVIGALFVGILAWVAIGTAAGV